MELVDKDKTVEISVVSVPEEQGGDTCEGLVINQAAYLSDFSSNMISLLRKYDHNSSDYLKRMQVVLDDMSRLDHQINLTKRGFRKRMRSAVDTSKELR